MSDQVPQNPNSATEGNTGTEAQPQDETPQSRPATPENTVSHKSYATLQTRLNQRNQEFDELNESFIGLQEDHTRVTTLADTRLQDLNTARTRVTDLESQLGTANAQILKMSAFKELISDPENGLALAPEAAMRLFNLLDDIPAGTDLADTVGKIKRFAEFGQSMADQRQQEVSAGATPGADSTRPQKGPQNLQEWEKAVANADVNDPIWEEFHAFVTSQE
jgi:hypothetical protein